ncbi:MAG TPA: FkbM family methyltransferase [Chitinophagaceae bacterium]|nr:FkbM family methyltransferase [Chitinophagaceae bacterium]
MRLNAHSKKVLKKIYKKIPLKKQLFLGLKKIYTPSRNITSHLYFDGIFNVKCNSGKFKMKHYGHQVENLIFWYGLEKGFEKESMKLWMKLCQDANVIFDIGANTGLYSLVAKTLNPDVKVFAFDPIKRIADKLRYNIELNNYDIEVIEKAVSNNNGSAIIYDYNKEHAYSATLNENFTFSERGSIETKVETIKLDTFVNQYSISGVDLIKIDVETHEPEVLEGLTNCLHKYRPVMLIEILNDEVGKRVFEQVKDLEYLFFNIDENGSIKRQDIITKSEHSNFLFCNSVIAKKLGLVF